MSSFRISELRGECNLISFQLSANSCKLKVKYGKLAMASVVGNTGLNICGTSGADQAN